jgi:hypothetical protein
MDANQIRELDPLLRAVSGGRSFDHFAGQGRGWPTVVCGG